MALRVKNCLLVLYQVKFLSVFAQQSNITFNGRLLLDSQLWLVDFKGFELIDLICRVRNIHIRNWSMWQVFLEPSRMWKSEASRSWNLQKVKNQCFSFSWLCQCVAMMALLTTIHVNFKLLYAKTSMLLWLTKEDAMVGEPIILFRFFKNRGLVFQVLRGHASNHAMIIIKVQNRLLLHFDFTHAFRAINKRESRWSSWLLTGLPS